jgi:type IV pilus assembly protein PilO
VAFESVFASITNQPRSTKIGLGVLLVLAIVLGGYFSMVAPARLRVDALRVQNDSLQAEVMQHRALAANLARFRAEAAELRRRLDAVRERLPSEKEIPRLYRTVSNLALQSGLAVSIFQPGPVQAKDYYSEVPITVSAEVNYHRLGDFFEQLAQLPRIVNVDKLRLSALNKPSASLRADMTLVTYLFAPEPNGSPSPGQKR